MGAKLIILLCKYSMWMNMCDYLNIMPIFEHIIFILYINNNTKQYNFEKVYIIRF